MRNFMTNFIRIIWEYQANFFEDQCNERSNICRYGAVSKCSDLEVIVHGITCV